MNYQHAGRVYDKKSHWKKARTVSEVVIVKADEVVL